MIPGLLVPERKLVRKPWGGSELCRWLGLEAEGIGETWEVFDRGGDSSRFRNPELAGRTLADLMRAERDALLGDAQPDVFGRFPLLLKFLDARERLSLQVHPNGGLSRRLGFEDNGKTECWVVLRAREDARLCRGLAPDVQDADFFAALEASRDPESFLDWCRVRAGDAFAIEAGTLHCVGAGLQLYEIQQNSDVTLRVHDWGRVDADGRSRPLHVEQAKLALEERVASGPSPPLREDEDIELLTRNPVFALRRLRLARPRTLATEGRCHLLTGIEGTATVEAEHSVFGLAPGRTCIVGGWVRNVRLVPRDPGRSLCALWARPTA